MPTIQLYANLRNRVNTKELTITGASLGMVIRELVEQYPALDGVILEDGAVRPHFVITVNGRHAMALDVPVTEQDLIAIFPPIAGG